MTNNASSMPTVELTRLRMFLFTFAAGAMIANIYYVQPLLPRIAAEFGRNPSQTGYLVTFTQLGYALGVLLLVPLGDMLDPRRLLTFLLSLNVIAALVAGGGQTFDIFAAASLMIGVTSSATMVLVPYVASLADPESRGARVGQMMTGALLGILLAWTVAGIVSDLAGWHAMYFSAAGMVFLLLFAIRSVVPSRGAATSTRSYPQLIGSLFEIALRHSELRWRSFYSALAMASFSAMWTGVPVLLSAPPYNLPSSLIGLFGLTGVVGAACTTYIGKLGDRGLAQRMTGILTGVLIAAWLVASLGGLSLIAIIAAGALMTTGLMGLQVTHQSVIYQLDANGRSRITAFFITSGFIGASLGSAAAATALSHAGWRGLCLVGLTPPIVLLCSWACRRHSSKTAVS
jgi:predicted MFS family arabinose efflux permease